MKKSNFVSFSNLIKNREREIERQPEVEESQADYEVLYHASQKENEALQEELQKTKQDEALAKESWDTEREDLKKIIEACEGSVSVWKEELRAHLHSIWKAFLDRLIQEPDFHRLVLHDMLAEAMIELSDQKELHVEVPHSLLKMAQDLLSGREGWNVVAMEDDVTLGVRFSTEHVHWETELEPVFLEFFTLLSQWLEERE
jgi:hypothetical protein